MTRPRRRPAHIVLATLAFGMAGAAVGRAQDSHYWTNQYGDRATLLGGAVVGSAVDLSAVYYNPGALSLLESPDLIIATKVFEWSRVAAQGEGEFDLAIGDDRLGLAPGFFAGLLPFGFLRNDVLGYSLFTRYSFDATLRAVGGGQLDLLPVPAGSEDFYGSVEYSGKLNETWGGLTWSRAFGNLGLGVSQFVAARSQQGGQSLLLQAYAPGGLGVISIDRTAYSFYNYRLLWKIGLAGNWQGWSVGATLTTPSVSVFGSGSAEVDRSRVGSDVGGTAGPVFVADYQDGLGARYHSPFSVAIGASKRFGATSLHASAEWFAEVEESTVLDPAPFVGQSTGDTLVATVTQSLDAVLNAGVGIQQRLGATTALYVSVRTDRSGRGAVNVSDIAVTSWDIYFMTAGARFRVADADFTLGLGYGLGSRRLPSGATGSLASGLPQELDVRYRNYRLIFAFAF